MEMKKVFLMFFLLFLFFFPGGMIFAQDNLAGSGNKSAAYVTDAIPKENTPIKGSPAEGETPFRLSETGKDTLFFQRLSWNSARYAVSYTVVLEQKRGNTDPYTEVLRRSTEKTYFDLSLPPGEYRFLVMSINVLGKLDAQTEWDYFSIRNPITLLLPKSGVSMSNNPLSPSSVVWTTELPLQNSKVIFSRDPDPVKDPRAIIQYAAQSMTTINLPPLGEGVWYWTVMGTTPDGTNVSATAPLWFSLVSLPPLTSPKYIQPGINEKITLDKLMADRKITFKWEQVPEANAYIFSIYGISDRQDLLFSSSPVYATSFDLIDLTILTSDYYFWQIEAVYVSRTGTIERRGLIKQQSFEIQIHRSDTIRTNNSAKRYGS